MINFTYIKGWIDDIRKAVSELESEIAIIEDKQNEEKDFIQQLRESLENMSEI